MSETRAVIEASFRAMMRDFARQGYATITPASLAGLYLDAASDAECARALVAEGDGVGLPLVRGDIEKVIAEERSERGPRLKTGTEGR